MNVMMENIALRRKDKIIDFIIMLICLISL